jgi:16S rRNA U1498 N3-methylase RsmE
MLMRFAAAELTTKACFAILRLSISHLAHVRRLRAGIESVQLITTRDLEGEEGAWSPQGFSSALLPCPVYSRGTYSVAD